MHLAGRGRWQRTSHFGHKDFYIKVTPAVGGKDERTSCLLLCHHSLPPVVREVGKNKTGLIRSVSL